MSKEIEIQVRVTTVKPLMRVLEVEGSFQYESKQMDDYFTPADRDFTAVRPIAEWLRLREAEDKYSVNYKYWHYDDNGRSHYCDEYESAVDDITAMRNLFKALKFRKLVTVEKLRKAWQFKDWEVAVDRVLRLGDFIEIEYKGSTNVDPKEEIDKMIEFLKSLGCGKIERNYLGYPFQLMFPDEVKWEEV